MKCLRRFIGLLLLSIIPACYLVLFFLEYGLLLAVLAVAIAIVFTGLILLGFYLFADD